MSLEYIRGLDGLRTLAVILVILFHFFFQHEYFAFGWIGVQIFFVLSGFLITSILLQAKKHSFKLYLKKFYWRRTVRIFPIYYFYIISVYLVIGLFGDTPKHFTEIFPFLISYTYNYSSFFNDIQFDGYFVHFWSLCVEEQFYLFWPFIVYFLSKNSLRNLAISLIVLMPFARGLFFEIIEGFSFEELTGEVLYWLTASHLDAFATGALIPLFNLKKHSFRTISVTSCIVAIIFISAGLTNHILNNGLGNLQNFFSTLGYKIGGQNNYQYIWSYSILNIFSCLVIILIIKRGSMLSSFFENEIMVRLGRISYGMYLYHWVILSVFRVTLRGKISEPLLFIIYLLAVILVSYLSYTFFEKKFLRYKNLV